MKTFVKMVGLVFLSVGLSMTNSFAQDNGGKELPGYLQDRGEGVTLSLFGTYVRKGEFIFYPFYEYEKFSADEYTGKDLGFNQSETEFVGTSEVQETLLFFGYGLTEDIALELETTVHETKTLKKDPTDNESTFFQNGQLEEAGFGATQAEVRWRLRRETETQSEIYTAFEVEFPLQKDKHLIGAQDWEIVAALGWVKGHPWGTLTPRISLAYDGAEQEIGLDEFALEYLKRLSPDWRVVTTLEGESDELSLIGELQYFITPGSMLKLNSGFGLSEKAPDIAPEVGILFTF